MIRKFLLINWQMLFYRIGFTYKKSRDEKTVRIYWIVKESRQILKCLLQIKIIIKQIKSMAHRSYSS